jgi:diguanylate cyclase (GGDEF)-like protein/PAS domain S-box-containing protein
VTVDRDGPLPEVLRALAAEAAGRLGADGLTVGLTEGPIVHYRTGVGVFEGEDFDASFLVPAARPLLEGRTMEGDGTEEVSPVVREMIERLGIRAVLSSPIQAHDRTCGVIIAVRSRTVPFSQDERSALEELARFVGKAIEAAWALRTPYGWLTIDDAPIGMAVSSVDGTFIEVNQSFAACLGWRREQLIGRTFQSISRSDDVELSLLLHQAIADGTPRFRMEHEYVRPDGAVVWADLSFTIVRDENGRAQQVISQIVDITDWRNAEHELAHRAKTDRLTGLPNRRRFTDNVASAIVAAERSDGTVAVLFLDLDRFSVVNESIGHEGGDDMLREVGRRLRLAARRGETVARFAADAFAILCENVDGPAEARRVATRLLAALHHPVVVGGREVRAAASVGVALGGAARPSSAAALLREADAACSLAKARGGGTVAIFDETLRDRAATRLDVEAALHHAVRRDELRLFYQPEVNLRTGCLVGFEALLRWEHPALGLLAPEGFLAVAEESGLVVEIGHWVLLAAAEQMGAWRRRWPELQSISMGVNVAARQLSDPRLPEHVSRARQAAGPGAPLCLEVTESELLASTSDAMLTLARLRREGVKVALDDLGTGYASLAYVAGLEADVLKVDRSFTAGLADRAPAAVVAALVSLAQNLRQEVVAEGVETPEQAGMLLAMGCEVAQGFLCGKPASAEELEPLLATAAAGLPVFLVQDPPEEQAQEQQQGICLQRGQPLA